jgi:hypothetical protein
MVRDFTLCKVERADDLVQETLLVPAGDEHVRLAIHLVRNLFRSEYRKQRREVQNTGGSYLDN